MKNLIISCLFVVVSLAANQARGQTLKGSPASVKKQYTLAQTSGFKFIQTSGKAATTVKSGKLHRVSAGPYLELHNLPLPLIQIMDSTSGHVSLPFTSISVRYFGLNHFRRASS